jgi:hypothetical protein
VVARVSPSAAAGLQELKLEPTAFVAVSAGKIANPIEWPPNPTRVEGVVRIEGDAERPASLTLAPGAKLYFTPEARLIVGGFGPGSLNASASTEQDPAGAITLRAAEDSRAGSWSGIHVQDQGELILRHVELAHGGARDEGVVLAEGDARVTLAGCEFVDNLVGLELRGEAVILAGFSANGFANTPVAVRMPPTLLAGLGADNRYDDHATLEVTRGRVEADATWAAQAAPIVILGDLFVDKGATLTVASGSRLRFAPGVVLGVGYYERASLDMRASAEAPILLEPARDRSEADALQVEPQPWGGVVLGAHAHKARFEHVKLYATANAAGIELRETAEATLVNVECTACAGATVTWGCKSKIGNIGVTAGPGTPKPMAAPTCR